MRPRRARPAAVAAAVLVASAAAFLSACGGNATTTTTLPPAAAELSPCGTASPASSSYAHVMWIWMENKSYGDVIGSSSAPFQNSLASKCGLATNYHNITHLSLANYIAATSGIGGSNLGPLERFQGDCAPSPRCSTSAESVFGQVAGWRAYEESMPTPCDREDSGRYAVRHNPPPYFTSLTGCRRDDVALGRLAGDLARDSLPAFSFVTPNLCHDAHDCGVGRGDAWLAQEIPTIVRSPAYRSGRLAIFITYDEGVGGSTNDCATDESDVGCHIATLVLSPTTPAGTRSGRLFNHYSLLRTTEDLLGVPHLGAAAAASSMAKPFGLQAASG